MKGTDELMSLISKEVEITLSGNNIEHYRNLGYEIPTYKNKWGRIVVHRDTKIKVKVEDLTEGSNVKVKLKCDNTECEKIYSTFYSSFLIIIPFLFVVS